jgi:hypothetical protein
MNEVTIFGKVHSEKSLSCVVTNEYEAFLKSNLGKRIVISITLIEDRGTILQEIYFKKVVLKCLQKGFKETGDDMSLEETEERCLDLCPATANRDPEEKLTKDQWSRLIEWSIRFCAENFSIIVPEPNKK